MKSDDFENVIAGLRAELPVREIAKRAGISRAHAHRLIAGDVRRPSHEVVQRLQGVQRAIATSAAAPKVGDVTKKD
jgi:hypothetical protein